MAADFDFDSLVDRRSTASLKWDVYPPDVLPFWVADMDFPASPAVVAALEQRASLGVFGYSKVPPSLIDCIREFLASCYGWPVEAEWLVFLPSVVAGLDLSCRAFAGPREGVMTVKPVYPPFLAAPANQGRRLQAVPAVLEDGRWQLPLAAMEESVTEDTRVLLFCHPHNPLGRAWREEEVAAVVSFCERHNLILCSDEIHCGLVLDPLAHVVAAGLGESAAGRTVTLMSPSKSYNLPGLNFAFAVIPDEGLRWRFREAARGLVPLPGCFAIAGAEAAYRESGPWLAALVEYLRLNRDLVEQTVASSFPGVAMTHVEATYLAWLDVRSLGIDDPAEACVRAGVALSDGAAFGASGFLRLNFGCPRARLEEGLRRLRSVLGEV